MSPAKIAHGKKFSDRNGNRAGVGGKGNVGHVDVSWDTRGGFGQFAQAPYFLKLIAVRRARTAASEFRPRMFGSSDLLSDDRRPFRWQGRFEHLREAEDHDEGEPVNKKLHSGRLVCVADERMQHAAEQTCIRQN